jgi:hypothetical protein
VFAVFAVFAARFIPVDAVVSSPKFRSDELSATLAGTPVGACRDQRSTPVQNTRALCRLPFYY